MKEEEITKGLRYFFKRLEKKSGQLYYEEEIRIQRVKKVPFEELEKFVRALMTQNIFIFTVGINGKRESTILNKAMFNTNNVIRLYYSTSLDEFNQGYLLLRADSNKQLVLVERLHGVRPKPEVIYASLDENHVIRFFVNWILRRVDWDKTRIKHLELYKKFKEVEKQEHAQKIANELAKLEELNIKSTFNKHFGETKMYK
jgi:hypothetical protein